MKTSKSTVNECSTYGVICSIVNDYQNGFCGANDMVQSIYAITKELRFGSQEMESAIDTCLKPFANFLVDMYTNEDEGMMMSDFAQNERIRKGYTGESVIEGRISELEERLMMKENENYALRCELEELRQVNHTMKERLYRIDDEGRVIEVRK